MTLKQHRFSLIRVPAHRNYSGKLIAFDGQSDFNIEIKRVFFITELAGALRGKHAHKRLSQVLICLQGACRVTCEDKNGKMDFLLDDPQTALCISNGVWSEQYYLEDHTIVAVLCDGGFDESEYIRDYEDFLTELKN